MFSDSVVSHSMEDVSSNTSCSSSIENGHMDTMMLDVTNILEEITWSDVFAVGSWIESMDHTMTPDPRSEALDLTANQGSFDSDMPDLPSDSEILVQIEPESSVLVLLRLMLLLYCMENAESSGFDLDLFDLRSTNSHVMSVGSDLLERSDTEEESDSMDYVIE